MPTHQHQQARRDALRADRLKALDAAEAIVKGSVDERGNDRELTAPEAAEVDAHLERVKTIDKELNEMSTGRITSADGLPGDDIGITPDIRVRTISGVRLKHFNGPREVRTGAGIKTLKAEERAYRFGMLALAILSKTMPARYQFPDAERYVAEHITKLHTTYDNTTGGYTVPEEFGMDLIDLREQYGVVRRIFRNRTLRSDTRTDPRRTGGLTAYFVGEGGQITESTKAWDRVGLTAKTLAVLSRYTNQLSMDSVLEIGDDLAGEIAYAFSEKEDDCGINGDGTSTYGGIVGLRTQLTTVNGVDDGGGLVLGSGNAWSELTLADFNRVVGRLPQFADTLETRWLMHRAFYFGVAERLALAAGGVPAHEIREGRRVPLFLGYPVQISQKMPSSEANSQVCAVLGDFSKAASFGDRMQDSIAFSDSATIGGENVFERNEIAIRGTERFDINVHDVGTSSAAGPVVGLITAAA